MVQCGPIWSNLKFLVGPLLVQGGPLMVKPRVSSTNFRVWYPEIGMIPFSHILKSGYGTLKSAYGTIYWNQGMGLTFIEVLETMFLSIFFILGDGFENILFCFNCSLTLYFNHFVHFGLVDVIYKLFESFVFVITIAFLCSHDIWPPDHNVLHELRLMVSSIRV